MEQQELKVALAQMAPVWLHKVATLQKVAQVIIEAASCGAELIVFGEAFVPGYPFWLAYTEGASWDFSVNKEIHAHYVHNAVQIEAGDLYGICDLAAKNQIAIYLGVIERPKDRGGHSIYASLVYINAQGSIESVHRKLRPTYDERLTWASGDGHGLRVHPLKAFTVGGLNCWENWMPLARAALYGQGENLHVAVWPGNLHNTQDITRFIARESRSYVISVAATMQTKDFPEDTPHLQQILNKAPKVLANGGSCIAAPDGSWAMEPVVGKTGIFYHTLDFNKVLQERQNFDPVGHYSRPDVTKLTVNRERQSTITIED